MSESSDEVDLGPTHALMAIPEPQRSRYCKDVIKALADALEDILKRKSKITQARKLKLFMKDLDSKRDEIEPVLFYTIKQEFREMYLEFMGRFSKYIEEKKK